MGCFIPLLGNSRSYFWNDLFYGANNKEGQYNFVLGHCYFMVMDGILFFIGIDIMKNWKTIVALIPLTIAIVYEYWWMFSIFFFFQIGIALKHGQIEFVEVIRRKENPFLFWILIGIWVFLGSLSIINFLV
jgi:hypothetical protein